MANVRPVALALSMALAFAVLLAPMPIEEKAHRMLAITVLMGGLWASEALPLHITALLGTVLAILFVPVGSTEAFAQYFSPVVVLLFGGMALGRAMEKHGLDRSIASWMLARFGRDPRMFLLGLMTATAFLSFWISNTATAAMMMPIAISALAASGATRNGSAYAKAAVIAVGYAATIGGIGTIVGTPPNAIAVADLAGRGTAMSFLDWMYHAVPFVALLIPLAWAVIVFFHPPEVRKVAIRRRMAPRGSGSVGVLCIGAMIAALWLTSAYHHIPDSVVAVIGIIALHVAGLLDRNDISKINWGVLLLVGGSLALAYGIGSSGLSNHMAEVLSSLVSGQSGFAILLGVGVFTVIVTSFMSNTATAALVVPIVAAMPLGAFVRELVIMAGMASSLNFITPAGTPPSAMAYSSGYISVWDMIRPGIVITLVSVALLALLAWLYW